MSDAMFTENATSRRGPYGLVLALSTALLLVTSSCLPSDNNAAGPVAAEAFEDDCVSMVIDGPLVDRQRCLCQLHGQGISAIPFLIAAINNSAGDGFPLVDPMQSGINAEALKTPNGIIPAYIIELILARDSIDCESIVGSPFLLGADASNYLFSDGLVKGPSGKVEEEADLKAVQSAYRRWWQESEDIPFGDLCENWRDGRRPLDGSSYYWR